MFFELLTYSVIGVTAGFLAGLLGVGGGIIVVPSLFFFMNYFQVDHEHLMHLVIATSLASMIFSTASSVIAHQKEKGIHWQVASDMLIGLSMGCLLGAYIAKLLSTTLLTIIFGVFLIATGIQLFFKKKQNTEIKEFKKPRFPITNIVGFSISFTATLLGIGGGLFTVPVLSAFHMKIRSAIATSAAITFFITIMGSISFFLIGLNQTFNRSTLMGFIYFPAFVAISLFSFIFAPLGVIMMHHINTGAIKKIFSVLLFVIGIYMIISGF